MKKSLKLFLSLLFFCHTCVFAQDVTITGKVTGQDGEVLPGVNVRVNGTSTGVTTDALGNFTLKAAKNASLLVSYVGYTEQTVNVIGRVSVNVTLLRNSDNMQTIVVTALGIKKEAKKLGYATASVNNDQISTNRTSNVMGALQGKMSGVNITTMGSGEGGSVKVRIRGQSSFSPSNNPLYIINGVPMDNSQYGVGAGTNGKTFGPQVVSSDGGDGLASLNPDDIETMTVLKGATASALYGSRAKDGVVMITTKNKGNGKGIGVDYNVNYTRDKALDYTDFQYEYGQGERGIRPTTAYPQSGVWSFGEKFQPGMTQVLFDGKTFPYEPVHDRYDKFYQTGTNLTNTITLSTAGDNGGINLSLANTDNKGIIPESKFNRKTVNLGFTQTIAKKLIVSGNVNYSNEKYTNPPQVNTQDLAIPTVMYTLANSMPIDALANNVLDPRNGNELVIARFLVRNNPYYSAQYRTQNVQRDRTIGNITLKYNIFDWLYIQGRMAQDVYTRYQDMVTPNGYAAIAAAPTGFVNGYYTQEIRRNRERNYDFLVGANRKISNFGVDLMFGGNQLYRKTELNGTAVQDFVIPGLYTVMNGRVKDPYYSKQERKVNSLYGAAEISYKNFLFVNITARNDWFSTLSADNLSVLYPSITGSFVFTDAFDTKMPSWLNFGKLRVAYAEAGSDTDVDPYAQSLYYGVNNSQFGTSPVGGINGSRIPNPDLRPLRLNEFEVGLEARMFNNRVGIDLAYYTRTTNDQILPIQVSDASSYTSKLINVGSSRNQGIELGLNLTPIMTKDFKWDINANMSYNTSEVLQLGPNASDTVITLSNGGGRILRQVVGKPIGALYTYMFLRDAAGKQVFDKSGGLPMRNETPQYVGNVLPKYFGGITNTFNYKSIILTVLIDYKLGSKMIAGSNQNALRHGLHKRTLVGRADNYVIGEGVNPDGNKNVTKANLQPFYEQPNVLGVNEWWVSNAGFWKLRQITLGYDFTKYFKNVKWVRGLRLSAVCNNVAIIKKWTENMDPESLSNVSDNENGLDFWTAVPPTRSLGFNLAVKF